MAIYRFFAVLYVILFLLFWGFIIYLLVLIVKALRKYINSDSKDNKNSNFKDNVNKFKKKKNNNEVIETSGKIIEKNNEIIENNIHQEVGKIESLETNMQQEIKKEEFEENETDKSLAELLKENRMKCKMTQEFVSERLGVSRQAVSKWENGSTEPSTSNLIALAKLYDVSAEELLKNATKKNKN